MVGVLTEAAHDARTVKAATTAALLATAIEHRATVYLRSSSERAVLALSGTIIGGDAACLTLTLRHVDGTRGLSLLDGPLEATVEIEGRRYRFETRITAARTPAVETRVSVAMPERLVPADRRRSPRRQFRCGTHVTLTRSTQSGNGALEAVLLNLSPEGMACRLAEESAASLSVGQAIGVEFELGAPPERFDLRAQVCNMIEGGTPGQAVIGLAFSADGQSEREQCRLGEALRRASRDARCRGV
ncbi:MAG: PilZ domain-containing protein [Phycisphaerae bacterium]|jgi:hypothetical protein